MKLDDIKILIEKWENAETSIDEERTLQEFFQRDIIPPELLVYKDMFSYFVESSTETYDNPIFTKPRIKPQWWSIAASVLVLIGIGGKLYINHQNQVAYEETKEALLLVSNTMNRGTDIAVAGLSEFGEAQSKVFK